MFVFRRLFSVLLLHSPRFLPFLCTLVPEMLVFCILHSASPRRFLPVFFSFTHLCSVVDRHRVDADPNPDPDPTFQLDADTDPDHTPDVTDAGKAELF